MNKHLWSRLEFLMFGGAYGLLGQQNNAQKESPIPPYAAAVLRKQPDAYFRLGEQDGPRRTTYPATTAPGRTAARNP